MARNRLKTKGRGKRRFVRLLHDLLNDPRYIKLSHPAKTLLIDIMKQYNGFNNGDLCITLSVMRSRGWTSNSTLWRARDELLRAELILLTRQGGKNKCSLYALSWEPINDCKGKLDIPETKTPLVPLSINLRNSSKGLTYTSTETST